MIELLFAIAIWVLFAVFSKDAITAMLYATQEAEISARMRAYIEVKYSNTKLEYLINCPYCLSYWCSLALVLIYASLCLFLGVKFFPVLCLSVFLLFSVIGIKIKELKDSLNK